MLRMIRRLTPMWKGWTRIEMRMLQSRSPFLTLETRTRLRYCIGLVAKLWMITPYLLRRLKRDVEKELPSKYEHLVLCRLSKRQRFLYDEFMARADTREDLNSGQYHRIANILMQLRKVCNHPDLFEVRPVVTSFAMPRSAIGDFEIKELLVRRRFLEDHDASSDINIDALNLRFTSYADHSRQALMSGRSLRDNLATQVLTLDVGEPPPYDTRTVAGFGRWMEYQQRVAERDSRALCSADRDFPFHIQAPSVAGKRLTANPHLHMGTHPCSRPKLPS